MDIRCAFALLVFAGVPATASAGPIADAAVRLQPGEWEEIDTGLLVDQLLEGGTHHILQYTDDAQWDRTEGAILFMGAGHGIGTGRFLRYDEAGDSWSELPNNPSNWVGHAYDHNAFDPERGTFYHRVHGSFVVHAWDVPSSTWATLPNIDALVQDSCCGALEYFPEMNSVVFFDGSWGVASLDVDGGSWVDLGAPPMGSIHNVAEYSAVQGAIFFGGGNGSPAFYRLDADGSITTLADAPLPQLRVGVQVTTADPNTGVPLVFDTDASYEYDPDADAWLSFEAGPFIDLGDDGAFGAAAAVVDTYGVVFIMKYTNAGGRTWIYRHSAGMGDPIPPGGSDTDNGETGDGEGDDGANATDASESSTGSSTTGSVGPGGGQTSTATSGDDPSDTATDASAGGATEGGSATTGCSVGGSTHGALLLLFPLFARRRR